MTNGGIRQLTGLHKDWVTKARYIPDLSALVTSSLDCTINLCDPEKIGSYERFRHSFHTFRAHSKGVYSFDWSRQNSFIASCGLERNAYGWARGRMGEGMDGRGDGWARGRMGEGRRIGGRGAER